uniref:NAC domain-containing protein n=1 Tax=Oryza glumipatula TaxID=40148 RepID=A0A0D9Y7W2_9ORYZ
MAEQPLGGGGGDGNNNGKWKGKEKVVPEYGKNRHGMPVGCYFVPKDLELFAILRCKLVRSQLPGALNNVFEHIRILEFHPPASPPPLYLSLSPFINHQTYIGNEEDGYIYFFSRRQFVTKARNKRRPTRVAKGGTWKASGGSKTLRSKKVGGIDVGQKLTMVFYERRFEGDQNPIKTNWSMHEFTKIIDGSKNQEGGRRTGERCRRGVEHGRALHVVGTATSYATAAIAGHGRTIISNAATATAIAGHGRTIVINAATATAIAGLGRIVVGDVATTATAIAGPGRIVVCDVAACQQMPGMAGSSSAMPLPLSLPGLAGGMMSMADQANMASTSQASTPSSELLQDWYDEFEITYGAVAPPSPSTISWEAPQSSPTGWWPSPNGEPVQHDGYLGMAANPTSYMLEHPLPTAAIPPEPMTPPTSSPAPPPAVDNHHRLSPPHDAAGSNYNHPELAGYNGGVQAQHEHQHQPQELQPALLVDGEDGYGAIADGDGDTQLGVAELDTERIAEMVNHIMDGEFEFKFEDNTVLKYNEVFPDDDKVVAAPMMIDGGGDGDGADGGDGGDPFDN